MKGSCLYGAVVYEIDHSNGLMGDAARRVVGGLVLEHRLEDARRKRLLPADLHRQGLAVASPPTSAAGRRPPLD